MAYSLTWLATVLRQAGLKVSEVNDWQNRGRGDMGNVRGVMLHHTAGPRTGNMPTLDLLIQGRSDLSGPLSQLGLARDGTYYVIAAGRANHAGPGNWQGITSGNSSFIGIEAENTGLDNDFPWPDVQMDAYRRGVAAILKYINAQPVMACGHREYAGARKIDPTFDMDDFRADIAEIMGTIAPSKLRPTLRRGDRGATVSTLQSKLEITADGIFGPQTEQAVKAFQNRSDLTVDGIVGSKTWAALDNQNSPSPNRRPTIRQGDQGTAVSTVQSKLGITADGIFGPQTKQAVIRFQTQNGLVADGIIGPQTWAALDRV